VNRNVFKIGAAAGVIAVAALAAGPALAASSIVSQASAQSLDLSIGGTSVISQQIAATNTGSGEKKSSDDTLPDVAHLLPTNSLLGIGAAPQDSGATVSGGKGHSYACAGIAGTGGGIVHTGTTSCDINGQPLTLNLGKLNLGNILVSADSTLGTIPGISDLLNDLSGGVLNTLVTSLGTALAATPLGDIDLSGALSAIESTCTADPGTASGKVHFLDTSGASTPISITLPTVGKLTLVNLPVNPPPNTHVLTNLNVVVNSLTAALGTELTTILNGKLDALGIPLSALLTGQVATAVNTLVSGLEPLLKPLEQNVLDITLNKQPVPQASGTFKATALDLQVLPAAAALTGASLISGDIGTVSCGPDKRVSAPSTSPTPTPTATPTTGHHVPTNVDSGLTGSQSHANEILAAVAALLALAGAGGTLAYRRYGMPRS
jgi:hypothetical protein